MKLAIVSPDYSSDQWAEIPVRHRNEIRAVLDAIQTAPEKGLTKWFNTTATALGMKTGGFKAKYYALRNTGDWTVLIDRRVAHAAPLSSTQNPRFIAYLLGLVESYGRKSAPAFKELRRRWRVRDQKIPGYEDWQGWPEQPEGWSSRNLADIVRKEQNKARLQSVRAGTSSKTNPFLPTVLTTRVGLWPGAVIQLDDMRHNFHVTVGRKRELVLVNELGASDLSSADRFHWGAKPRRKRADGTREDIAGKDMRCFVAGMFHRFGYAPQGTMLMSEHQTAKVEEAVARMLYDATKGMVRVEWQPIEGKQAALNGYWPGSEGGNFRAKALLESTHNLIQNDLAALPLQTGSFSSGIKGTVTTDRIVQYITAILRDVAKHVPHRLDLLRLPTWDFHTQLLPFLTDYYHFGLSMRTEHALEGWEALNRFVTEYTTVPGSGHYLSEQQFLKLPAPSQVAIREASQAAPKEWTRRRPLSPGEVFAQRGQWLPVPQTVLCDIIGQDMAREVTCRRGFLEFADEEVSLDPMIYKARYIAGPRKGQEIGHGEKVLMFIFPFDDSQAAIAVDAKGRYLGELPLYKRVMPINPDAFGSTAPYDSRPDIRSEELKTAAGEKHSRIADILEPARIHHAEAVQEARDLREHNRRVKDPKQAVTAEELVEALAAKRAARTSAAASDLAEEALANIPAHAEAAHKDDLDF
jgi:hypothetical protein